MWIRCKTWERIGTPRMSQFPRHIYIDLIFKNSALILCIHLVYTGLLRYIYLLAVVLLLGIMFQYTLNVN